MNTPDPKQTGPQRRRDVAVAAACGLFVAAMVGAAFASVPFYNWFCRATGFAGTTQVATSGPATVLDRKISIRFDANVATGLPWRFEPDQTSIEAKIGEVVTVGYTVVNELARDTVGQASYNVAPPSIGAYFSKINCFCFTEQHLKPGEKRDMTVVFFVDPALVKDHDQDDLNSITLSYTMYSVRGSEPPRVEARPAPAPGRG